MPYETVVQRDTVASRLDDPAWLLFDCRFELGDTEAGRRAFAKGHLPGAVYVHVDEDLAGPKGPGTGRHPLPDAGALADRLRQWGVTAGEQLVAYDGGSGAMAVRFWWLCRHLGLHAVALMSGGFEAWRREGRPLVTEVQRRAAGHVVPDVRPGDYLGADALQMALARGRCLLLDARSPERFRGEHEPMDARAGHVPGAVNRPFADNLDQAGEFKTPDVLRREFERILGRRDPGEVVHMCGSGVTACHNLLAMEHAGLTGSRLYPGSWSEWITDPDRPVATGDEQGD